MKKLVCTDKAACMACRSCEIACSTAFYKKYDPDLSCIHVEAGKNGEPVLKMCLQCGKCMRTCKHGAISQNPKTGVYMVNKKLCVGCGECKEACPMHVMPLSEDVGTVSKCIACGICAKACPMGILEVQEKTVPAAAAR